MSNPYEIRLDVVKLAKEILESEKDSKMKEVELNVSGLKELYTKSEINDMDFAERIDMLSSNIPSYSEEDVLSKATSIYNFVSKK